MGHDGVASGIDFRRLTGCQRDFQDRGVTEAMFSIFSKTVLKNNFQKHEPNTPNSSSIFYIILTKYVHYYFILSMYYKSSVLAHILTSPRFALNTFSH